MIYKPKKSESNIDIEYTGGGILFNLDGTSYSGEYLIKQNLPFSIDENKNIIGRLFNNPDKDFLNYKKLNANNDEFAIKQFLPAPNKKDYDNGNITRYFLKRKFSTDIDIIEVSSNVYNQLKGLNNAVTHLYDFFELLWVITGNKEEVRKTNFIAVQEQEKEYTGINRYLSNLIQFWKVK